VGGKLWRGCYYPEVPRAFASLPRFHKGSFWLFVVVAATTALVSDRGEVASQLLLGPGFSEGQVWQPLTALALFPPEQVAGVLLTLVIQWFVGGQVEARWGTRRYLTVVLGCGLMGYLGTALIGLGVPEVASHSAGGSTPIDLAALLAFGTVFARIHLRVLGLLPITGRGLAILGIVLALISPLARGAAWPQILPSAIAIVTAILWIRPFRGGPGSRRPARRKPKSKAKKSHLRVVGPDDKLLN